MSKRSGQWWQLMMDGYEFSGDLNQVELLFEHAEEDLVGFLDPMEHGRAGMAKFTCTWAGFVNNAAGRSHDRLKTPANNAGAIVSIMVGFGAVPVIGDPAFQAVVNQYVYTPKASPKQAVHFDLSMSSGRNASSAAVAADANAFVLANTTITTTTLFASRDNGAATSNGGVAYLQALTAPATDTYEVKCQDSPDDSTWADLCTFSADGSTVTAERQTFSGAVDRYERATATRTGSAGENFELAVTMARK